jgi:PAS domain-containing protein
MGNRDKSGNRRIIELSAYLVKTHEGKKLGFRGIARDVTERFKTIDELKEAQRKYEQEFEAKKKATIDPEPLRFRTLSHGGVFQFRKRHLHQSGLYQVFGWRLEEVIGRKIPYFPPGMKRKRAKASSVSGRTPMRPSRRNG